MIKIYGGTSRSENLCLSCRYYHSRREADSRQISFCTFTYYSPLLLQGKVTECNSYYSANATPLEDMKKIAWVLRTSSGGRAIGFVSNKDYREKEGDRDLDDLRS